LISFTKNKAAISLVTVSVLVGALFINTVTQRVLTGLEGLLFQLFIFASGLIGSFLFGKQSAEKAAKEIIKPHARSAFRRLISLYRGLSRIATVIVDNSSTENTIAKIEEIVISQISTADDALKDWEDVVPEDVEEIKKDFLKENNQAKIDGKK
tara:strand:- start:17626 stop:18087 length:462 start_codon:yes stop_codon:yes gene_type:complete